MMLIYILLVLISGILNLSSSQESSKRIWSVCNKNGSCSCGQDVFDAILCNYDDDTIRIQDCYCMFYDQETSMPYVGTCLFTCFNRLPSWKLSRIFFYSIEHYTVENASLFNEQICSNNATLTDNNRQGRFCGQCKSEFGIAAYSYHYTSCIECADNDYRNWIKFFAAALLPLTLFVFLIIIMKINVPSSHLNGIIFMMQCMASPALMRSYNGTLNIKMSNKFEIIGVKIIYSFLGIFNLDFFVTFILTSALVQI